MIDEGWYNDDKKIKWQKIIYDRWKTIDDFLNYIWRNDK